MAKKKTTPDRTKFCFFLEIWQIKLISTKDKTICTTLNYVEHIIFLTSAVTGCATLLLLH